MTAPTRPATLTALHGDSWTSPWFILPGAHGVDLNQWRIRAQARQGPDDGAPLFDWTVAGGGILAGSALLRRISTGAEFTVPTLRLRLRPRDWVGKPRRWEGFVEVELARGDPTDPDEVHTVVPRRRFEITADLVP